MLTLQRPDPKVSALMGEDKGIKNGDAIRPSIFAIPMELGKRKVVLNTFTCHCIETDNYEWFADPGNLIYDENDLEMKDLVTYDYLVRDDFDEMKKYTSMLPVLRRMEKSKPGYTGYTILPTTYCNARCVYCYEQGVEYETMSDEILEQTIRYILATKREEATVNLHWFGGEPLLGEKHIDRICEAMREAGVEYISDMVSNGSLMTEEIAARAKEDWHINNVQITLDGREDMYCERKRYKTFKGSPYKAVLNGIHALLNQDIHVSIRLNVDEENLDELMLLTDELEKEFKKESMVRIYCHSIFEEDYGLNKDNDKLYSGMDKLNDRLEVFNRNRRENRKMSDEVYQKSIDDTDKDYYDRRGHLRRFYCMADSPTAGPIILPNGRFNLCEHIEKLMCSGSVYDKVHIDKESYIVRGRTKKEKCQKCGLLPICTDFTSCPSLPRDCYKEILSKEKSTLRVLENEDRLPPISMNNNGMIIRVTEPTADFIEASRQMIVPSYLETEITMDCEAAKELLLECAD